MISSSLHNKPKSLAHQGFSLLEVLVAVAVLGIALLAVIRSTQQASNTNAYLQDKISANIVCSHLIANINTGVIPIASGDEKNGDMLILGRTLHWTLHAEMMGSSSIMRVVVTVDKNKKTLTSLKTYLAVNANNVVIL